MTAKKKTKEPSPWEFKNIGINYEGTKITLPAIPENMDIRSAIEELRRLFDQEESYVDIHETVDCFPLEGAYAFMEVLKKRFGWARAVKTKYTVFGMKQEEPPELVSMEIGVGKTVQVVWGSFELPGLIGHLQTGRARHISEGRAVFCIKGNVQRKFEHTIKLIAEEVRRYVAESSIYKGRAIQLILSQDESISSSSVVNWSAPPKFVDTRDAKPNELIFSDEVQQEITASLFTPIRHTTRCRDLGIPLKRGVLLAGKYGTGKTLTANVVAQMCEENGWTYIHLRDVTALNDALLFARRYQPAVVFAEDVDRAMTSRSQAVDDILNTIDGVDSKSAEIITILTTNYVDRIEAAMLRPGRLDAVINVTPPDAPAVARLIHMYGRGLVADGDLNEIGSMLAGQIPATIREVVERAKLYAVEADNGSFVITEDALCGAARGMEHQLSLLNKVTPQPDVHQNVGRAVDTLVSNVVKEQVIPIKKQLDKQLDSM